VVHGTSDIGRPKVASAAARLKEINPEIEVVQLATRLTTENAAELIADHDLVADGSDNFPTRYLVNDACYLVGRPLVSAAIMRFDGQLSTYRAFARGTDEPERHPCYRCLFGEQPPGARQSCADVGVLGALAGAMGTLQAVEVIKELVGIGESLSGHLLLYEALGATFRKIKVGPDPGCALCGPQATIKTLEPDFYREREAVCAS
jgi:adenylyltransferase/sulfurtransferase